LVAGVDEDVVFSLFDPPEDECPVVVVFLPMLEHHSATSSFNAQNPLIKPKNRAINLKIKALMSKMSTKLQDCEP